MTEARDAALDRTLDALAGGGATGTAVPDASSPANPLRFDGHRYDRTGRGAHATDAFTEPLPSQQIGPAWWIESLTQTWAGYPAPVPRSGLCLDTAPEVDENGSQTGGVVYVCLEEHSESLIVYLHRLDVAADDVNIACPGDRHVKPLRQRVMQALGGARAVQVGRDTDAEWLAGAFATLGVLLRKRTGRR